MALTPGTRLGPYDILSPLGSGGMVEVYKARDTRLARTVAIKVLPADTAADVSARARFEREARAIAALSHPHICVVHDVGHQDGIDYLVMELLEGETLLDRLAKAKGPLPLDQVLSIGVAIADALDKAHRAGIVHRDLKPANVMLTKSGPKLLDFGLAKLQGTASPVSLSDGTAATTTGPGTAKGTILGTIHYMAPEQVEGREADTRTDIWALGALLYEMATGQRPFTGESAASIIGAILKDTPPALSARQPLTPPAFEHLVERCLAKDPDERWQHAGDVKRELAWVASRASRQAREAQAGATVSDPSRSRWQVAVPWAFAVVAVLVAGWTLSTTRGTAALTAPVTHVDIGFPRGVEPSSALTNGPVVSPDGRVVGMIGVQDGVRRVFVRRLEHAEATELPGTQGANSIAFSPDGGSLAVNLATGVIVRIALGDQQRKDVSLEADTQGGLTWSRAGIIFGRGGALWIIPVDGGAARRLTTLDATRHEVAHDNPVVLPGERFVLFTCQTTALGSERIEAVPIDGGPRTVVVERAGTPIWSSTGHLIFARDGALLAANLDPTTATLRGTALPVMKSGVVEDIASGNLGIDLSSSGTLLYRPSGFTETRVVSVGRDGAAVALDLPTGRYTNPRVAPDGRRLLVENAGTFIEAFDLERGTRARLTAAAQITLFSTWNADGTRVVFKRLNTVFWAATDGSGTTGLAPGATINDFPSSPGPTPDSFIALRIRPETSGDIFLESISGAFEPKPLVVTPAYDGGPQLSPDGHWLLYQSAVAGQAEIYLRPYPAMDRTWQVSAGGGVQARWARNSRTIYYRGNQHVVEVAFDPAGAAPTFGKPVPLFADEYEFGAGTSIANYDVTADGRFIMIRRGASGGRFRAVINWTDELTQLLATGGEQ